MRRYGENVKVTEYHVGTAVERKPMTLWPDGTLTDMQVREYPPTARNHTAVIDVFPNMVATDDGGYFTVVDVVIADKSNGEPVLTYCKTFNPRDEPRGIEEYTEYDAVYKAERMGFKEIAEVNVWPSMTNYGQGESYAIESA
ncbi:hypothetical protein P4637_11965 [Halalkalibacterium halodurans]|uniref:hypothetical protein n=1 Tax=Halalkalibacterium halodurans TaxID=86665 RepID=UPI002E24AE0F|nr:hypothetical protein [Halalkalibacterium halodurans]MED4085529.1 hypothetical protein [Halalkalibacterium halodurans]MED4103423.1 hypothetical protein [Halalkalibacterium halodurans]MED4110145.1 hypothetical protein [Halalkalibacterium halodurans]MED4124171.1 hypothetical protein [Halalkalibacterium halodurans]